MKKRLLCFFLFIVLAVACKKNFQADQQNEQAMKGGVISANIEPDYPVPCGCDIVATNWANDMVEVYDPKESNWNTSPGRKWQWKPVGGTGGFTAAQAALWQNPVDAKVRFSAALGSDYWLATVGGQLATIVSYTSGVRKWSADIGAGANPQSIELMPNGNVAVSAAYGNWVRVYESSQGPNDTSYAQFNITLPHAVQWDPTLNRLWVTGQIGGVNVITALIVGGTPNAPTLTEDMGRRSTIPASNTGRDIGPYIGDANKLMLATSGKLYVYNKTNKSFTEAGGAAQRTYINAVSFQPIGQIVQARNPSGAAPWTTNTVEFYASNGALQATRSATGAAFFRAKSLNPNYEFRSHLAIATWNVQNIVGNESGIVESQKWANRRVYFDDVVKKYDFDIFGVQEPEGPQIDYMIGQLSGYSRFGVSDHNDHAYQHQDIFYKSLRFQLQQSGKFWLAPNGPPTHTHTSSTDLMPWSSFYHACVVTWGKFLDYTSGKEFFVINAHFDTNPVTIAEQANLVLSKIPSIVGSTPFILMGDLNTNWNSAPYISMNNANDMQDGRDVAGIMYKEGRQTGNWYDWPLHQNNNSSRDYVFVSSDWQVKSYNILVDIFPNNVYVSDHWPVMLEAKLP